MTRTGRLRRKQGDVVAIPLGEGLVGFGWIMKDDVAFIDYAVCETRIPPVMDIVQHPIAFRIWVMDNAFREGNWFVVGHASIPEKLAATPWLFKQDALSGKMYLTQTGAEEVPAGDDDWQQLECAAVWEPAHVEDRLRDHFAGRPNRWVEALKPRFKGATG